MKKVIAVLFMMIVLLNSHLNANELSKAIHTTVFKIKFNFVPKEPNIKTNLILVVAEHPLSDATFFQKKATEFKRSIIPGDENVFEVKSSHNYLYFYIYYDGIETRQSLGDNIYLVKSGKEIKCEVNDNQFHFSGKDSEILNVQHKIIKKRYIADSLAYELINRGDYAGYLDRKNKGLDSALTEQLNILKESKHELGEFYYNLLEANCYGMRNYIDFSDLYTNIITSGFGEELFNSLKVYYNTRSEHSLSTKKIFPNEVLVQSPIYANYILQEMILRKYLENKTYRDGFTTRSYQEIFDEIVAHYTGSFKDKLLTIMALRLHGNVSVFTQTDAIAKMVKDPIYKSLLPLNSVKNAPFFNFKLSDTTGKIIEFNEIKEKVVFIDFWYTGCMGCIKLSSRMPYILEKFKDSKDVLFLSISIDKDKSMWINNGIKSGKYTHHGQLNLYTNGEGDEHDLIKYYDIIGYPKILLVSNGKIHSSSPPDPRSGGEFDSNPGQLELIKMIEEAIKANNN